MIAASTVFRALEDGPLSAMQLARKTGLTLLEVIETLRALIYHLCVNYYFACPRPTSNLFEVYYEQNPRVEGIL